MHVFLGIDVGTTSTRALAVNASGRQIALTRFSYEVSHPREGWGEQDAEDFWFALTNTVRKCVTECEACGFDRKDIRAMALSVQGDSLVISDSHGNPIAPAWSWMDVRAAEECRELVEMKGADWWYRRLGVQLTASSTACKIRWIKKHDPDLFARACFGWIPDFLYRRLTGRLATDASSASWGPLYEASSRRISSEILDLLELSGKPIPDIVWPGEVIGYLTERAALELGLYKDVKVVAGSFDQSSAAYGAGIEAGQALLSCGTAWVLFAVSEENVSDPLGRIPVCCHIKQPETGLVLPFPGGSTLQWLLKTLKLSDSDLEALNHSARKAEGPVFIPHLYGGFAPDWETGSRGSLLGLDMAHEPEDILIALMRGIAGEARRNVEAAERLTGRIESITMAGGAGRSAVWPQMIADLLNIPVRVSDFPESACFGAARLAADETGLVWNTPGETRVYYPQPQGVEMENRHYRNYLRCYQKVI